MAETGAFVFLHASNRTVDRAWPVASGLPDARFARMPGYDSESAEPVPFDQDAWESRLLRACPEGAVVVAHSFGGPVAMRAAARRPDLVQALVLFEPAAYALARGTTAVEDHIRRMQPVLDRAGAHDAPSFAVAFGDAMTGRPGASAPTTAAELLAAERQRMLPGPWTLDTPDRTGVPTLVVTGGWNDEYETIAARIDGAAHVVLAGHGHRPQDHQDATRVVLDFVRAASPR